MKINDMFQKNINRQIQGVIKIGQDDNAVIANELDEYVVTRELHRHFDKFFQMYRSGTQKRTDKIGVWISGFFGSGKSHFLKILSYLVDGKQYGDKKAISYFDGKIADSRILADMQLATDTSADVILFNIDAEADSNSKSNKDPIVKVFMKVFNRMLGFCATMPWIADLERQMVKEGSYDDFRNKFKEISGSEWEVARQDFYFEQDNIIQALSEATRMSAEAALAWYNKAEANYSLDINSFAKRVREYIEKKEKQIGKKQFVVFLCDEVGQYIGSSGSLMLNLQNIVEGLGNECGGRAWVICTGQEDIDSIVKVNRDNFSKIIGRFDTRLSLSSANVDEVIKKRLLAKTEGGADKLRLLYGEKSAALKNLITFSQDTPEKRLYDSETDFIEVYPFIPYQFNLLQAVFNGIRTHGASGKHLSEGERSLLNAFQDAAIQYANFEDGILIPFDAFYKTVETFLDHNIRKVVLDAEESAEREDGALQPYDVEVLKVLFMVKYIDNVLPANLENIATIMLQNMSEDKIELKKKIDASLRRLEAQRLIAKHGDSFVFLTNEEQDINREIREIRIDQNELIDRVGDEVYGLIMGVSKKYRHNDRQDFGFNFIIDERPKGNQREEIGIRVLTSYFTGGMDERTISLRSMNERNVVVALANDTAFLDEIEQAMQIGMFLRRNSGKQLSDAVELIVSTKKREKEQREARCRELIVESLKKAKLFVNGNKLDIREKTPDQRMNDAFKVLVDSIYSKQGYVSKPFLTTESLRDYMATKSDQLNLDGVADEPNHLAVTDMLDVIQFGHSRDGVITLRSLFERFGKMPYGWKELDVAGIVLTLLKSQKIRFELNGETVLSSSGEVVDYVTKREYLDRLVIKWRDVISPDLVTNAKDIAREVFGRTNTPSDEDSLMTSIKTFVAAELRDNNDSIKDLLHYYDNTPYPGKKVLDDGKKLLEQIERFKDIKAFYDYLRSEKESLYDYAEDIGDIKIFFKSQKKVFDDALKMLGIYDGNRSYVLDNETIDLINAIEKITKLQSPYSEIHKLPDLVQKFTESFGRLLEAECVPIEAAIKSDKEITQADLGRRFIGHDDIRATYSERVRTEFDALLNRLSRANNIYIAISMKYEGEQLKVRHIQSFIDKELELAQKEAAHKADKGDKTPPPPVRKSKTLTVKNLFAGTTQLSTADDVDRFVDDLRKRLKEQIEEDTTIHII